MSAVRLDTALIPGVVARAGVYIEETNMSVRWTNVGMALILFFAVVTAAARADFMAVEVAEMAKESVVTIETVSLSLTAVSLTSRQQRIVQSYDTGLVITKDGYILTDAASLEDAEALEVTLGDGRKFDAETVVQDKGYGLGLIKLKEPPPDLKVARFALDSPVRQGESVVVVGTAGGYGHTVSYGIISAIRTVRLESGQLVPDMIQSDVVVNTGNEGSPLFNSNGEVVGIQAVFGGGSAMGMQNVTFFMPATLVKKVIDELIETEEPAFRPWLGIMPYSGSFGMYGLRELSDDLRMYMNLPDEYWDVGMLIYNVWEGSPAYDAGLRYQDFVVKINGELLKSIGQLEKIVYEAKEGDVLVFGIIRRDRYRDIECEVGDHPEEMLMYYF